MFTRPRHAAFEDAAVPVALFARWRIFGYCLFYLARYRRHMPSGYRLIAEAI